MIRPKPTSETALSRAVQQCLKAHGILFVRVQSGLLQATYKGRVRWIHCAQTGAPDLWTELCGGTWLEIKTATGRLTVQQKLWHERARKGGINVSVVRAVADVLQLIREHRAGCQ